MDGGKKEQLGIDFVRKYGSKITGQYGKKSDREDEDR